MLKPPGVLRTKRSGRCRCLPWLITQFLKCPKFTCLGNQLINHIAINGCHGKDIPGIISRTFFGHPSKIAHRQPAKCFIMGSLGACMDRKILDL